MIHRFISIRHRSGSAEMSPAQGLVQGKSYLSVSVEITAQLGVMLPRR
jgi:hypothetical protein